MVAYRKILLVCFALFLSSCAVTPVLTVKNADMSREIKQNAPLVNRVEISPDGRYVLSGGYDSFILWDILQAKKIQTFTHPKAFMGDITAVAFSPDGRSFASGGKGTKLWDLATRQEIMTFDNARSAFIAFSPDGKQLLCGGPQYGIFVTEPPNMKIFDIATGRESKDFDVRNLFLWSVAYSPDGKYVLSGGSRGKMDLWDTSLGKSIRTVVGSEGGLDPRVNAVAFSPNGEYALSGGTDNSIRLWNAKNFTQIKKFVGHTGTLIGGVTAVAFSPDSKYALSAGNDGQVKIWDLAAGTEWKALAGQTGLGASAKFSPNGKYVISAGDASTKIWDVSTGKEVAAMIAFEDGEWVVSTTDGYYNSSPKGDQYLSVKVGGKDYSIEQLRESFYRPDLVKLALGGGS
ncbi:MAG: WD40 repeat domain-containing protein [Proteobacteria bacterium]|nr:WD40 repeat domain-containing protein [Pseudomonadota bacterium]